MSEQLGGCLCGAVRYRVDRAVDAGFCHCSRCRRHSGAPVTAWALVEPHAFHVEVGEPREYEGRAFCTGCGSSLFHRLGGEVAVALGSLDDPGAIRPSVHRWTASQVNWLKLADLLPFSAGAEPPRPAARKPARKPVDPAIGRDAEVSLRPVTAGNLRDLLLADVTGPQRRFVATNAVSLAQAYLAGDTWHRAICAGDTVVGFTMAAVFRDDELGCRWIGDANLWRFMIDEGYQRLGFGGRALRLIVDELGSWPGVTAIWLGCVRGPGSPYELYRRFGFEDTGVDDEGERIMRLPVGS